VTVYEKALKKVYGQICWRWSYRPDANLWLDFGEPRLSALPKLITIHPPMWPRVAKLGCRKRVAYATGRWQCAIEFGYWEFMYKGTCIARASSSRAARNEAQLLLEGQRLVRAEVNPQHGATLFKFDLDGELRIRRMETGVAEPMWHLYEPSGYVLSIRCDGRFDHAPGGAPMDKRPAIIGRPLQMMRKP